MRTKGEGGLVHPRGRDIEVDVGTEYESTAPSKSQSLAPQLDLHETVRSNTRRRRTQKSELPRR